MDSTHGFGLKQVLRDLALWQSPRPIRRALVFTALVVMATAVLVPDRLVINGSVLTDGHALESMDLAINRAWCGTASSASTRERFPHWIRDHIDQRFVPLQSLIAREVGSLAAYCGTVTEPMVNNENSLMLLESWILRIRPNLSVSQLGQTLHLIRLACAALFVLLLLSLGASLLFSAGVLLSAVLVLGTMQNEVYSAYPFLFTLLLLLVALYGFAAQYRWSAHPIGAAWVAGSAGLLSALIANMRTSYLPVTLAFLAFVVIGESLRDNRAASSIQRVRYVVVLLASFGLGYWALQFGLLTRYLPAERAYSASHSIGHPLVLSLSVPENDFSRELGITWLDEVGRQKALSVDPDAVYLGPKYDAALITYYTGLWQTRPWDMAKLYRLKFRLAGTNALGSLRATPDTAGRAVRALLRPYSYVADGMWLLGLYVVIAAGGLWIFVRRGLALALVLGLMGVAASLLQIESGLIYSSFVEQYHNYLGFLVLFLSLAVAQATLNGVYAVIARAHEAGLVIAGWRLVQSLKVPRLVRACAVPALGALLVFVISPTWFELEAAPTVDRAAAPAIDQAAVRAWCGTSRTASISVGDRSLGSAGDRAVPLRTLIRETATSLEHYCQAASGLPSTGHLLTWIEAALLGARPGMSAAGIGRALHLMRVLAIALCVFSLVWLGAGWLVGGAVFVIGLWLLSSMRSVLFSPGPFAPVLLLGVAIVCAAAMRGRWGGAPANMFASSVLVGLAVAITWHFASGAVATMAVFLLSVTAFDRIADNVRTGWTRTLILFTGFVTGVGTFAALGLTGWPTGLVDNPATPAPWSDNRLVLLAIGIGGLLFLWLAVTACRSRSALAMFSTLVALGVGLLYLPVTASPVQWNANPLVGLSLILALVGAQAIGRRAAAAGGALQ